jgi:enediyne biosynthesis protein E7
LYQEIHAPETPAPAGLLDNYDSDLPDRVFDFCRSPLEFLLRTAQTGRFVPFRLNSEVYAVTGDPDILHRVLAAPGEDFCRGDFSEPLEVVFGKNVLTTYGAEWASLRAMMAPLFTPRSIEARWNSVQDLIACHLDQWSVSARTGEPLNLLFATKRLAFDVVAKMIAGISGSLADETFEALNRVDRVDAVRLYMLGKRATGLRGGFRTSALSSELDRVIYALADKRLESIADTGDMLSTVMAGPFFQEMPLERRREFLRAFLSSILSAGYVTTADTMFWSIYLLAQHQDVQDRLGNEAPAEPSPLLKAVINETLRLYPAAWYIGRVARKDVVIGDVGIAAGTKVISSPYVLHRMPQVWPEPNAFRPERFMTGAPVSSRAFIPFGSGLHSCLGRGLALLELNGLLPATLRRFRFQLIDRVQPAFAATFSLQPREPIAVQVTSR